MSLYTHIHHKYLTKPSHTYIYIFERELVFYSTCTYPRTSPPPMLNVHNFKLGGSDHTTPIREGVFENKPTKFSTLSKRWGGHAHVPTYLNIFLGYISEIHSSCQLARGGSSPYSWCFFTKSPSLCCRIVAKV